MIPPSPFLSLTLSSVAILLTFWGLWQIISLNRLRKAFFAGPQAMDLESVIRKLVSELNSARAQQADLESELAVLKQTLGFAIQKFGLVRFNPFNDGGGNFSFVLALLDSHNSGVVITSMYGREQNRIYAKKILAGKSEGQLTEEEKEAIHIANDKNEQKLKK